MKSGNKGMGSHKHGISGVASKSPKFRMNREIELRKQEMERKRTKPETVGSIRELFKK